MGDVIPHWLDKAPQWVIYAMCVALAARWLSAWWTERRKGQTDSASAAVTDAATVSATLATALDETRKALRDEREDNRSKDARIDQLEARCEELRQQIIDQRSEYDEQIRALQAKVFEVTNQLDSLRQRLEADFPQP